LTKRPHIVAAHRRFNGICQVASVCTPPNTIGPCTRVHNPNGIVSAIFAQLMAERPYLQCTALYLKIATYLGDLEPIYYMIPWAYPIPQPKQHLDWIDRFCAAQRRVHVPYSLLYNGPRLRPSKLPLPTGDLDPRLTHDTFGPPESSTQTEFRSVESFCICIGLTTVTDRPTEHVTPSVTTGRIYVSLRSTAMRPIIYIYMNL